MPISTNYRRVRRGKKQVEPGQPRKIVRVAVNAAAPDPQLPDSGITTPSEQRHRPWLVPGVGKL